MKEQLPFQLRFNQQFSDLNPVLAGESLTTATAPRFPIITGEVYMIHYVRCGKGLLLTDGKQYPFHAGQLIILPPGRSGLFKDTETAFRALRWVGFNGTLAHRFSELPVIVDAPPGTFENLCDLNGSQYLLEHKLASELFFLYSALLPPAKKKVLIDPVEWIKDYVGKNYMNNISVVDLAAKVGLDPDYLTRKFKKKVNLNIQSYIIQTRITAARNLLAQGMSLKETAAMCGFGDSSSFSRAFKKYDASHRSPAQWRTFFIEFHRKRKEDG